MSTPSLAADLLLDAKAGTAERPVWDGGRLLWVDVPAGEVHALEPATASDEVLERRDQPVGFAALREAGGLVLGGREGLIFGPELTLKVARPNDTVRLNDGLCDPAGRLWAGTLDAQGAGAALYCLSRSGGTWRLDLVVDGVKESNGLDWSVDGTLMYWIDTATGRVDVFDYDLETGQLANRRPFAAIDAREGVPDGLIVDAEGGVWVAVYGGGVVRRYDPTGRVRFEVRLPARRPTCPTFGGPDLEDLFITTQRVAPDRPDYPDDPTAGGIFACRPGFIGRPARAVATRCD